MWRQLPCLHTWWQKWTQIPKCCLWKPQDNRKCSKNYTRWFKYDRDWFVCKQAAISPGHIWTTLYLLQTTEIFRLNQTIWNSLQVPTLHTLSWCILFWIYYKINKVESYNTTFKYFKKGWDSTHKKIYNCIPESGTYRKLMTRAVQ